MDVIWYMPVEESDFGILVPLVIDASGTHLRWATRKEQRQVFESIDLLHEWVDKTEEHRDAVEDAEAVPEDIQILSLEVGSCIDEPEILSQLVTRGIGGDTDDRTSEDEVVLHNLSGQVHSHVQLLVGRWGDS